MTRANLHPNPLSGYSEDYPDPEDHGLSGPQGTEAALSATDEPLLLASQNKDADHDL